MTKKYKNNKLKWIYDFSEQFCLTEFLEIVNNMIKSEKMYLEAEKKFSKNEQYIGFGLDLYKYLLKHK